MKILFSFRLEIFLVTFMKYALLKLKPVQLRNKYVEMYDIHG